MVPRLEDQVSQQHVRERIVDAAVALYQEVGPARTTVAEIARRARVQSLTVNDHFPRQADLLAASQEHFLARHPPPDFADALALGDPGARVRTALRALYRSYSQRRHMTGKVLRDRTLVPELDALLARTTDVSQRQLADMLTAGFESRGPTGRSLHAVVTLALDFWTWNRLSREGLSDGAAADLMADLVAASAL